MRRFKASIAAIVSLKGPHRTGSLQGCHCAIQEIRIVIDQNDIRRHPSRFLHELSDFGPDLDAIHMLFDWLVTGGQVVATHVVRAQSH